MKKLTIKILFVAIALAIPAGAQKSAVPDSISYQGRVETPTGPLGAGTPVNRTVTFRIWNHPTNKQAANLIYSEEQTVTIFEGQFSVLVGKGTQTSSSQFGFDESDKKLSNIGESFGESDRYLGVTVDDGTANADSEISPRHQIVSGGFAFRAKAAERLDSINGVALSVADNGHIGIGTESATRGKLEIVGFKAIEGPPHTGYAKGGIYNYASHPDLAVSIYATHSVLSTGSRVFSDARIKDVKGRSNGIADLDTLNDIEITDYNYRDRIKFGNATSKKVIAQQVEKVFPQAVNKSTDVIPDVFQPATVNGNWIQLKTKLKTGDRVQLIEGQNQGIYKVLEIRNGAFRTAFTPRSDKVFVYGREVTDFRVVDYEAIAMLNVSATQQINKEVISLRTENRALRAQLTKMETREKAREARLISIEKALMKIDQTVPVTHSARHVE